MSKNVQYNEVQPSAAAWHNRAAAAAAAAASETTSSRRLSYELRSALPVGASVSS